MTNKRLNVGIFTHDFYPYVGGQGRFVYEFYKRNQRENKFNLLIFSPSTVVLPNHITIFPETLNSKLKNIDFSIKLHHKIEHLIQKYNLNLLNFQSGPGGLFFTKKVNTPVTFTSHHTYWQQAHYIKEQKWKRFFYFFEKKGFKQATKIICDCSSTKNILEAYYNITPSKISIIPIGIDKQKFTPKKHLGTQKDLIYIGRIDKRKGVDFLLKAMVLVNKTNPSIRLHIVGKGKDKNSLQKYVKYNKLNVKFHGFLSDDELKNLYEKSSVQVIPSVFEGFGLTVIEGMAKKIPIIATKVDGIKDIIDHKENGILVKYGDATGFSQSILTLIGNVELQDKLINRAYRDLNKFNWSDIYLMHDSLFSEVVGSDYV